MPDRYLDDFRVGDVYVSQIGRTVLDADNYWFTAITHNTNQVHFNAEYAATTEFGKPLVNSLFTLALVHGLSVEDTSKHAVANLGWKEISLPHPVFAGDTLHAETEVLAVRDSRSRPGQGIVTARTRGRNQRGEVVVDFERSFLIARAQQAQRRDQ
jgi:itaconyl-CoA hydratase